MSSPLIHKGKGIQGSGMPLMARILKTDGSSDPILQADIDTIEYHYFDEADPSTDLAATPAIVVADVIFDILQLDEFWDADDIGYNFRYDIPAAELINGNRTYRYEFKITPLVGEPFIILYEIETVSVYSEG